MEKKQIALKHAEAIKKEASLLDHPITIMEICGGHTNVILKYGIREIIPKNIRLISGPGCPVCVSGQHDIDALIELALNKIPIATYSDMMRVPGTKSTLEKARAEGGIIYEIYSATELTGLQKKHPNLVFFGVGFETTAPMTAFALSKGITVYSVHKLVVPAMQALLQGDLKVDGFIDPGHVSTIMGIEMYKSVPAPQVITGFDPERILRGIRFLIELIRKKENIVINAYPEIVKEQGNKKAQELFKEHFVVSESEWRGLGIIPKSGFDVKDDNLNAKIKYKDVLENLPQPKKNGCRCGEVLKGLIEPIECPLYRKVCTPENPKGACMVSEEGSCAITYRHGK